MESLICRNGSILLPEKIKQLASDWNSEHCDPPLEDSEFEKQWKCAANLVATTNAIKKADNSSGSINWKNTNTDGNALGSSSFNTTYGKRAATITDISSSNSTTVTKKREHTAYKYSNNGKSDLHEAVIVAGLPVFVKYDVDDNKVKAVEQLEESSRIIKPPNMEEYPYEPYEFANVKEIERYIDKARGETVDSLYQKIKSISQKYNDQDGHKIVLLAADIVWSFFQDKFSTTHYVAVIGDNGSGKSTYGDTFGAIGYRAINMTDPTAANIFRVLGTVEPGQCTIIADEAEKIDQSLEIMSTLKTGYHIKSKVPRVNMNNGKQDFFWTFCFKMMIAERSPDISKAKGVMDRTFKIKTYKGRPQSDIKEVLKPSGNPRLQSLLNELTDLRKLLLVYRLIHFKDAIVDIDIGLEGRNKELCKPLLQLFYYNTNSQNEIKSSLQKFVDSKNQTKGHTIEAVLYPIVVNLISKIGNKVYASQLWCEITHNLDGKYDDRKPNEYHTVDYNILYRNTITNIICDKFGASREHKKDGTVLVFDVEKLLKIGSLYDLNDNIQVKEITGMEDSGEVKGEGCESSEGSIVYPCTAIQLYEPIPDSKIDLFRNYHP